MHIISIKLFQKKEQQRTNNQFSKIDAFFFLLACWCFLFLYCSQNFLYLTQSIFLFGFHPCLRCRTMQPFQSMLQAILERELQPQLLQILTFSSWILNFFQQRQHSQMNLRMLVIFLPSIESNFIPIWTATFCRAKSALTNHMLKVGSYSQGVSALNEEVISAIFFSQFLVVIQPSSPSDSLEEDETLRLGLAGTTVHPSSSLTGYFYFTYSVLVYYLCFNTYFFSQTSFVFAMLCSLVSYSSSQSEYSVADSSPSSAISRRSSFQWMGGGYFLKESPRPYFLQSMYVIAMSSISTRDKEAISPVFLENSLTSSRALSSQSIVSISKGKVSTNYLVLRSFNSPKTSSVVTILQVELRFLMLLMEMNALASRTTIDFLSDCIVEYLLILAQIKNSENN